MKKSERSKKSVKPQKPVRASRPSSAKKKAAIKLGKKRKFVAERNLPKMVIERNISVIKASYLHDNVLLIVFSNGKEKEVDFSNFFNITHADYLKKYKSPKLFKRFKVENGNIVWGKDWDLIFPVSDLYAGHIK